MKLFFEDRFNRMRQIAEVETNKQAAAAIKNFLDQYNYISHYTRSWIETEEEKVYIVYDVGSHTEFFKLEFDNYDAARAFFEEGQK